MAIALVSVTLYRATETPVEVLRGKIKYFHSFFLDYEWPLFRLDHPAWRERKPQEKFTWYTNNQFIIALLKQLAGSMFK